MPVERCRPIRWPLASSPIRSYRNRSWVMMVSPSMPITEVMGMEGDTIITQDLFLYDLIGEDANGHLIGRHRSTGIGRPRFWDRARYYGEEKRLAAALDAAEVKSEP